MIPMPRKWITVNIPADMHDHITELIEHPRATKHLAAEHGSTFHNGPTPLRVATLSEDIYHFAKEHARAAGTLVHPRDTVDFAPTFRSLGVGQEALLASLCRAAEATFNACQVPVGAGQIAQPCLPARKRFPVAIYYVIKNLGDTCKDIARTRAEVVSVTYVSINTITGSLALVAPALAADVALHDQLTTLRARVRAIVVDPHPRKRDLQRFMVGMNSSFKPDGRKGGSL